MIQVGYKFDLIILNFLEILRKIAEKEATYSIILKIEKEEALIKNNNEAKANLLTINFLYILYKPAMLNIAFNEDLDKKN